MDKLSLLTKYDFSDRIDLTFQKIGHIQESINKTSPSIIIEGIFVTLFASFEICLSDLLSLELLAYPQKLPKLELPFTKEEILQGKKLNIEISKHVQALGYKSLKAYMVEFQKIFSIELKKWSEHEDKIIEFKARRNLLLHNDLIVNLMYLQQSGVCTLATEKDMHEKTRIEVTYNDVKQVSQMLSELLTELKNSLNTKMKSATRIATFRKLWECLFNSKIMKFDEWVDIDESEDKIIGWKKENRWYHHLSGSETMLIDFISNNFFYGAFPPRDLGNWQLSYPMLRLFDNKRCSDFEFLVANFDDICKVLQRERG